MPGGAASAPPVLRADALRWGTLAAVRDLGRRGIPVTVASDSAVAPARSTYDEVGRKFGR